MFTLPTTSQMTRRVNEWVLDSTVLRTENVRKRKDQNSIKEMKGTKMEYNIAVRKQMY